MSTHATITVQLKDNEFHANMLADGYPEDFGSDLHAIMESVTPPETEAKPELADLETAFFSPIERDILTTCPTQHEPYPT